MANTVFDGTPSAVDPHLRFDEGNGASTKPRRSSLLYANALLRGMMFAVLAGSAGAMEFDFAADHANGRYRVNETARFTVTAKDDAGKMLTSGTLTWRFDNFGADFVVPGGSIDLAKSGNPFTLEGRLPYPGFLRLVLNGGSPAARIWSVAVEPERIRVSSPRPADFDVYWDGEIARLAREVPLDPQMKLVPEKSTGAYNFYEVSFATFGGRVHGFYTAPKDTSHPWPAIVSVPGAGPYHNDSGLGGADHVSLLMNIFPFVPSRDAKRFEADYETWNAGWVKRHAVKGSYGSAGIGVSREAFVFHAPLLGINRAVDWLAARPEVDAHRIGYTGSSQGGAFGLFLMGLNRHFTRGTMNVPAMCDHFSARTNRRDATWPNLLANQSDTARSTAEAFAPYFDAAHFAPRIRVPVRMVVGGCDVTCPPAGGWSAFNALAAKDKWMTTVPGMGHGVRSEVGTAAWVWTLGEEPAVPPAERLRRNLLRLGSSRRFVYAWSTSGHDWEGDNFKVFRKQTGTDPLLWFAEFRDIGGTWYSPEEYARHRVDFARTVKREYAAHHAVPMVTWHLQNPYTPSGWAAEGRNQGMRYRHSSGGYPQEHRWVLREIAMGTGGPCGKGRLEGENERTFPTPRAWFEWILKDTAAFLRTLVDERGQRIPIVFRLFHECDADWFWWGPGSATPADLIAVHRLAVNILRRELGAENVLFCYGTDRHWKTAGEEGRDGFLARYPGDDSVDIIGFDDYSIGKGDVKDTTAAAIGRMRIVSAIGRARGKVCGLFETGVKDSCADFYAQLHAAMTAKDVNFAIATTYDSIWTFPESEEGKKDMRAFFERKDVLSGRSQVDLLRPAP